METSSRLMVVVGAALVGVAVCGPCARRPVTPGLSPGTVTEPAAKLDRQAAVARLAFTEEVLQKIEGVAGAPLEPLTNWEDELTGVQAA